MPFITDSFNRRLEYGQGDQGLTKADMRSLLMNDVKMKPSNLLRNEDEAEKKKISDEVVKLLEEIVGQNLGEEINKLDESIQEAASLNRKYYDRPKGDKKERQFLNPGEINLGHMLKGVMRTQMPKPLVASDMLPKADDKESHFEKILFGFEKKWFELERKQYRLALREWRLDYLTARQRGVTQGHSQETPRETVLVDKRKLPEHQERETQKDTRDVLKTGAEKAQAVARPIKERTFEDTSHALLKGLSLILGRFMPSKEEKRSEEPDKKEFAKKLEKETVKKQQQVVGTEQATNVLRKVVGEPTLQATTRDVAQPAERQSNLQKTVAQRIVDAQHAAGPPPSGEIPDPSRIIEEGNKTQEQIASIIGKFVEAGLRKGSIFVHDEGTHLLLKRALVKEKAEELSKANPANTAVQNWLQAEQEVDKEFQKKLDTFGQQNQWQDLINAVNNISVGTLEPLPRLRRRKQKEQEAPTQPPPPQTAADDVTTLTAQVAQKPIVKIEHTLDFVARSLTPVAEGFAKTASMIGGDIDKLGAAIGRGLLHGGQVFIQKTAQLTIAAAKRIAKDFISEKDIEMVKQTISRAWEGLKLLPGLIASIPGRLAKRIGKITDAIGEAIDAIPGLVAQGWASLRKSIAANWQRMKAVFKESQFGQMIIGALTEVAQTGRELWKMVKGVGGLVQTAWNKAAGVVNSVFKSIGDAWTNLKNNVSRGLGILWAEIADSRAYKFVAEKFNGAMEKVKGLGEGIASIAQGAAQLTAKAGAAIGGWAKTRFAPLTGGIAKGWQSLWGGKKKEEVVTQPAQAPADITGATAPRTEQGPPDTRQGRTKVPGAQALGGEEAAQQRRQQRQEGGIEGGNRYLHSMAVDIRRLTQHALTRGSIFVHDVRCERMLRRVLGELRKPPTPTPTPTPGKGKGKGKGPDYEKEEKGFLHKLGLAGLLSPSGTHSYERRFSNLFQGNRFSRIGDALMSEKPAHELLHAMDMGRTLGNLTRMIPLIGEGLGGLVEDITHFVMQPLIAEMDYFQNLRQTAFETEGIRKGPTGEGYKSNQFATKRQEDALEKYRITQDAILETNQDLKIVQDAQMKNWKRGIREAKNLNRVTITGLSTARLIGAQWESTNELFADMHQNLNMGAIDLAHMGVKMQDIARSTGVTGDRLIGVVKSSEQFMKNMRNVGTLTSTAGGNIAQMMAEASKTGTTEGMSRILQTLSKPMMNWEGGDDKTRNLMLVMARGNQRLLDQMMQGTLMQNKAGLKELADNMEAEFRNLTDKRSVAELEPWERAQWDTVFEKMFGVGIKEFELLTQNVRNTSKAFADRYKVEKDDRTRKDMAFAESTTYISEFNKALQEATQSGEGMEGAFRRFNSSFGTKEFAQSMKAMGLDITRMNKDSLSVFLGNTIKNLNERLAEVGAKDETGKLMGTGKKEEQGRNLEINPAEIQEAINKGTIPQLLTKIMQFNSIANVQEKKNQDPISQIEAAVRNIEFYIRSFVQGMIRGLGTTINTLKGEFKDIHSINDLVKYSEKFGERADEMYKELDELVKQGQMDPLEAKVQKAGIFMLGVLMKIVEWASKTYDLLYGWYEWFKGAWKSIKDNKIVQGVKWVGNLAVEGVQKALNLLGFDLTKMETAVSMVAAGLLLFMTPLGTVTKAILGWGATLTKGLVSLGGGGFKGAMRLGGGLLAAEEVTRGGFKGYQEYEYPEKWRGAVYGMLTGSGKIEDQTIDDDLGAMGHGALVGGGIGTMIAPGVGTVIGAGVGAFVAELGQGVKVIDLYSREQERGRQIDKKLFDLHKKEADRLAGGKKDEAFAAEAYQSLTAKAREIEAGQRGLGNDMRNPKWVAEHGEFIRRQQEGINANKRAYAQALGQRMVDALPPDIAFDNVVGPKVRDLLMEYASKTDDASRAEVAGRVKEFAPNLDLEKMRQEVIVADQRADYMQHLQKQLESFKGWGGYYQQPEKMPMMHGMGGGNMVSPTGILGGYMDWAGQSKNLNQMFETLAKGATPEVAALRDALLKTVQGQQFFKFGADGKVTGVRTENAWGVERGQEMQKMFPQIDPQRLLSGFEGLAKDTNKDVADFAKNTGILSEEFKHFVKVMQELMDYQRGRFGESVENKEYPRTLQGIQQQTQDIFQGRTGIDFDKLSKSYGRMQNLQSVLRNQLTNPASELAGLVPTKEGVEELVQGVLKAATGDQVHNTEEALDAIMEAVKEHPSIKGDERSIARAEAYFKSPGFQNMIRAMLITRGQRQTVQQQLEYQLQKVPGLSADTARVRDKTTGEDIPLYRAIVRETMGRLEQSGKVGDAGERERVLAQVLEEHKQKYDPGIIAKQNAEREQHLRDMTIKTIQDMAKLTTGQFATAPERGVPHDIAGGKTEIEIALRDLLPRLRKIADPREQQKEVLSYFMNNMGRLSNLGREQAQIALGQMPQQAITEEDAKKTPGLAPRGATQGSGVLGLLSAVQGDNKMSEQDQRLLAAKLVPDYMHIMSSVAPEKQAETDFAYGCRKVRCN